MLGGCDGGDAGGVPLFQGQGQSSGRWDRADLPRAGYRSVEVVVELGETIILYLKSSLNGFVNTPSWFKALGLVGKMAR